MEFDKQSIGQRIRKYRNQYGFTQAEVAKGAKITRVALGSYERGIRVPPIDVFARIASVLRVSIDELFGYTVRPRDTVKFVKKALTDSGYKLHKSSLEGVLYEISDKDRIFFIRTTDDLLKIHKQALEDTNFHRGLRQLQYLSFQKALLNYEEDEKQKKEEKKVDYIIQLVNQTEGLEPYLKIVEEQLSGLQDTFESHHQNMSEKDLIEIEEQIKDLKDIRNKIVHGLQLTEKSASKHKRKDTDSK